MQFRTTQYTDLTLSATVRTLMQAAEQLLNDRGFSDNICTCRQKKVGCERVNRQGDTLLKERCLQCMHVVVTINVENALRNFCLLKAIYDAAITTAAACALLASAMCFLFDSQRNRSSTLRNSTSNQFSSEPTTTCNPNGTWSAPSAACQRGMIASAHFSAVLIQRLLPMVNSCRRTGLLEPVC